MTSVMTGLERRGKRLQELHEQCVRLLRATSSFERAKMGRRRRRSHLKKKLRHAKPQLIFKKRTNVSRLEEKVARILEEKEKREAKEAAEPFNVTEFIRQRVVEGRERQTK